MGLRRRVQRAIMSTRRNRRAAVVKSVVGAVKRVIRDWNRHSRTTYDKSARGSLFTTGVTVLRHPPSIERSASRLADHIVHQVSRPSTLCCGGCRGCISAHGPSTPGTLHSRVQIRRQHSR